MEGSKDDHGFAYKATSWEEIYRKLLEYGESHPGDLSSINYIANTIQAMSKFADDFNNGTVNVEDVLSISEIEELVLKLNKEQMANSREFMTEKVKDIDQKAISKKKKKNTVKKE
jgi:hypothetical protein